MGSLSLRKFALYALIILCSGGIVYASPESDLDARITTLQNAVSALQTDQPAAFTKFKQILAEANQPDCVLMVADVVSSAVGTVALPVTLIPGTFSPAGIQADFSFPSSISFVSATLGPIPSGEGKSIQTNIVGGALRVIVFGLNQTPITEGVDFTLTFKTTVKGQFPITISNPVASDASGNQLPLCLTSGIVGAS